MFPFNKFFIPKHLLACRLQCKEQLVKNLKNLTQLYTVLQRMKTLVFAIIVSMILGSLILRTGLHYNTYGYMDTEEFLIITTSLLLPIWTFFHKMVELFYADLRPRRQLFNRRDRSRGWHITYVPPHSISQNQGSLMYLPLPVISSIPNSDYLHRLEWPHLNSWA